MVGSDRSRIDLRWDRTKGYRRAVVIVRDGSGNKLNSLARASIRAKSLDPSELLLSSDVPTYVNLYKITGQSREEVENGMLGRELVGILDLGQKTINNIIDKVAKVPSVVNAPGGITNKIIDTISDFVKDRFEDSAWELVGNVTEKLREKLGSPRSLPEAITRNPTGGNEASDYVANDPNAGTGRAIVAPLAPTRGRPAFEPSSISLKPGESAKVKVVRQYGDTGVVAGVVSFAAEYSSADSPEDIEVLRPAYVFLDGETGPHEITVRAKAKSTSTSQKSFY
jgi:hypothetical protein